MKSRITFGVATILGGTVLEDIPIRSDAFRSAHRQLLTIMLVEIANPGLWRSRYCGGFSAFPGDQLGDDTKPATERERIALIRRCYRPLAALLLVVAERSGLLEMESGYTLTPLRGRVMLHLGDAQRFY